MGKLKAREICFHLVCVSIMYTALSKVVNIVDILEIITLNYHQEALHVEWKV